MKTPMYSNGMACLAPLDALRCYELDVFIGVSAFIQRCYKSFCRSWCHLLEGQPRVHGGDTSRDRAVEEQPAHLSQPTGHASEHNPVSTLWVSCLFKSIRFMFCLCAVKMSTPGMTSQQRSSRILSSRTQSDSKVT